MELYQRVPCYVSCGELVLFLCRKQGLIGSKWDRCYFFIQGGNLMCQQKAEVSHLELFISNSHNYE